MRPWTNHTWELRQIDREAGVWSDYVLRTERLPLWMNLDSVRDGGIADAALLRHATASTLTGRSLTSEQTGPTVEDEILAVAHGISVPCPVCKTPVKRFPRPYGTKGLKDLNRPCHSCLQITLRSLFERRHENQEAA